MSGFPEMMNCLEKVSKSEKRIAELDHLIKKIYEDNVSGKLSDKRFEMFLADYEKEQADLEEQVKKIRAELSAYEEVADNADKFIELIHRYTDFQN